MKIENTSFSIFYPKMKNLRKNLIKNEELFLEHYLSPALLAIPDDAPEEIPRMTMTSKNGHSNVAISLINATLNTEYDEDYSKNWSKCSTYLSERVGNLYDTIDVVEPTSFIFTGLVTKILIDNANFDPVDEIKNKMLKVNTTNNLFDVGCKFAFCYENRYFVNIAISNERLYEGTNEIQFGLMSDLKLVDHNISVVLDVNDRYGCNFEKDYQSTRETFEKLLEITTEVINNKLVTFLEEGVFSI